MPTLGWAKGQRCYAIFVIVGNLSDRRGRFLHGRATYVRVSTGPLIRREGLGHVGLVLDVRSRRHRCTVGLHLFGFEPDARYSVQPRAAEASTSPIEYGGRPKGQLARLGLLVWSTMRHSTRLPNAAA